MRLIVIVSPVDMAGFTNTELELMMRLRVAYGKPKLVATSKQPGPFWMGLTVQQEDFNGITVMAMPDLDNTDASVTKAQLDFIVEMQSNIYSGADAWIFVEAKVAESLRSHAQSARSGRPPPFFVLLATHGKITEIPSLPI